LISGLKPPLVSASENPCVVPEAVNVPIAYWPTPPTVLVVFASSVTVLPAVAVVFENVSPKFERMFDELFVHHCNRYCWPGVRPLSVTKMFAAVSA